MKRSRKAAYLLLVFALLLPNNWSASSAETHKGTGQSLLQFVPGRILVQFRSDVSPNRAQDVIASAGAHQAGEIPQIGIRILQLPNSANEHAFARAFRSRPD